jgi:hypothetical protein
LDEPWALVYTQTTSEGMIPLNSATETFQFSVVDGYTNAIFDNQDFNLGTWQVQSLDPFQTSIEGDATSDGHFGEFAITASMRASAPAPTSTGTGTTTTATGATTGTGAR